MIAMPEAIHAWLVEEISGRWPDPAPVVAALPAATAPNIAAPRAGVWLDAATEPLPFEDHAPG